MSLHIRREFRRIALLLVIAGMIMGLASPSACDEFYNNLLKLNGQPYEISSYSNTVITHDCINPGESVSHNQYRPIVRRGGNVRIDLFRLSSGDSVSSSSTVLVNRLSLLLLSSILISAALSYYHIIFIHLNDGHK